MLRNNFHPAMENIKLSPIVSISEEVRSKENLFKNATGKDFIKFQRGEIDFATPAYIVDAAKNAMDEGKTKYPKSGGEQVFKEAILRKLERFNKAEGLTTDNIIVTYGGQEALELVFKLFHGEKTGGFAPVWSCIIENMVPYAETNFIQAPLGKDFSVDFDKVEEVIKEVSLFYLNTPQNPTGKLFTKEEVVKIAELCAKYDTFLLSDEAYERITYDGKSHFSPVSLMLENTISAFTLSKTYSMTGWRLGYLVTRNKHITELAKLTDYTQTAGVTTFLQYAGAEALNNVEEEKKAVTAMLKEYSLRREALYNGLKEIDGLEITKPDGALYMFPDFSAFIPESIKGRQREVYVYNQLMENGVAVVYGSCFGEYFTGNLRFSFSGVNVDQINRGVARIRETLQR